MKKSLIVVLSAAVATIGLLAAPLSADAATSLLGNDVSQPQCAGPGPAAGALPAPGAFAVVGVNSGVANVSNSCFAAEYAWAQGVRGGTHQHAISYYVNTANPGLAGTWWPTSNTTQPAALGAARTPVAVANPYGVCAGAADSACAYVYGYSLARDDATIRGVPNAAAQWWLDVENANTWSPTDLGANLAVLEGMTASLRSAGGVVGVYSTYAHWAQIVGVVPTTSPLAKLASWVAQGPVSQSAATKACGKPSFTPLGRVSLTQFVSGPVDYDVSCLKLTSAPKPKIAGTVRVGHKLRVATHAWHPVKVKLTYRWMRNGTPIAHATHSTYVVKRADLHKKITVVVTGKKTGYSTLAKTSAAKKVSH